MAMRKKESLEQHMVRLLLLFFLSSLVTTLLFISNLYMKLHACSSE